ncbi:MAG TPA: efflux RND transporter periplasmic adaptor subunit, partial [Candidatus Acidoferrum sp.]|nr:efflux RND transporter periplasmic adaptor subunit [Candidatus Acidoferrum sp.]
MAKSGWPIAVTLVVILLGGIWFSRHGFLFRGAPRDAGQLPSAAVSRVARESLSKQVTIPAEFRPYVEAQVNAKVSGYVSRMNVDFGDRVKSGQLLATIEVPELQAQLDNAIATQQKAEADYTNADLIYNRLVSVNLSHPDLVAQQDLDTAEANDHAAAAAIAAAHAEVEKYQTLVGYTNILAPFDGIVTWRYADPGALIQAGTSSDTQSLPLVRVSDNYVLRLDFPVSVDYVKDIQVGDLVEVQVESSADKSFIGKITRFTDKVAEDTRTMMVEMEVPNQDLALIPGMYAAVVLKVEKRPDVLVVPIQAGLSSDTQSLPLVRVSDNYL